MTEPFAPPPWIRLVAAGDFTALPDPLGWGGTAHFALLVDGFAIAGGLHEAAAVHRHVLGEIGETGTTTASALDLWVAVFFEWRRQRFTFGNMDAGEIAVLDRLCMLLGKKLQELPPDEHSAILAAMAASPWRTRL